MATVRTRSCGVPSGLLACAIAALPLAILRGEAAAGAGEGKALRFVVYGGSEGNGPEHRAVTARIVKSRPEIAFHAGGLVSNGGRPADWKAFDEITQPLRALCSFYACRGRGESAPFCAPREGFPQPSLAGRSYYSLDHRGVHFVALDSSLRVDNDDPQTQWLAEDLAKADGRPVFVLLHAAVYGVGDGKSLGTGRFFWHPLFVKHKVRAVFSGAHHIYHRTSQDGVAYIATGGGGAPFDDFLAYREFQPADVVARCHHFIEVAVSPEEIRCRAIDAEGKTRDEFLLPAPPDPASVLLPR